MERWPQHRIGVRAEHGSFFRANLGDAPDHSGLTTPGAALLATKLCLYSIYLLRDTALSQTIFFLSGFSEDRSEYNKIKQSKFEYEGFGLDVRRNFQMEGGSVLKRITSGTVCHIIF